MNMTNNDNHPEPACTPIGAQACPSDAAAGQRRRQALQTFLDAQGIRVAELSRTIGLPTGNLLYNHLHDRSDALSVAVLERILDHFPDVTFEDLVGRKPRPRRAQPEPTHLSNHNVVVSMSAAAGVWTRRAQWNPSRWTILPLPPAAPRFAPDGFGVAVAAPGAEAAYPVGSLLACHAFKPEETLAPGTRVIVVRTRGQRVEVTVRVADHQLGQTWLMILSTHPEHQEALRVPTSRGRVTSASGSGFRIAGTVAWAWIPQPGAPLAQD